MSDTYTADNLLICIRQLATDPAITDTIWLPNGMVTVVEKLAELASKYGATDEQIELAIAGEDPMPARLKEHLEELPNGELRDHAEELANAGLLRED